MTNQNDDTRSFRPERFVSNGDEEFAQDWEILESEEVSEEDKANKDDSADDELLKTETHPPYNGSGRVADALRSVAQQFGKSKPK